MISVDRDALTHVLSAALLALPLVADPQGRRRTSEAIQKLTKQLGEHDPEDRGR